MPSSSLVPIVVAFAVCVAALLLFGGFRKVGSGFRATDYRPKLLLSRWELRALAAIKLQIPFGYHVCPQVRLADLVEIGLREPIRRRAALNRVASKSVDFAIIDDGGRVVLVVELDDASHARPDRRERDRLVDAVLARCAVRLARIRPGQKPGVGSQVSALLREAAE